MSIGSKADLTSYLRIYLDFAYFLCLSPFRLVLSYDKQNRQWLFHAKSWWLQKSFCIIITVLQNLWLIRMIWRSFATLHHNEPRDFIGLAQTLSNFAAKFLTLTKFWGSQQEIVNLANFIVQPNNYLPYHRSNSSRVKILRTIYLLCIFYLIMAVWGFATGRTLGHLDDWSLRWWWSAVKRESGITFYLAKTNEKNHRQENIVGAFGAVAYFAR